MAASVDPVHVLRGHMVEIQSLSFFSDDRLCTGDSNGELKFWDLNTCRAESTTRLHDTHSGVLHLVCLPRYHLLISQGRDGCVRLWAAGSCGAVDRSQPVGEIRADSFNFCRCAVWAPAESAVRPDRQGAPGRHQDLRVACAAHDPADVGIWCPADTRTPVATLRQQGSGTKHGMCMSLAFLGAASVNLNTDTAAAAAAEPAAEKAADAVTDLDPDRSADSCDGNATESEGRGPAAGVAAAAGGAAGGSRGGAVDGTAGDPRYLVAGYEDGEVALWDLRQPGRPLGSVRAHGEPVMCLDALPRRTACSAAGSEGAACGGGAAVIPAPSTSQYDLVSGSADNQVCCCVIRPAEAQPLTLAKQLLLREAGTADVRIRRDGKLFAAGCWDGRVRLYSLRRREPLAVLKYHRGQVTALAFSPVTSTLATASRDTTVALWSVYPTTAAP